MKISSDNTSSETVNYPTDLMRSVANQVLLDADNALSQHDADWRQVQAYIETLPPILQGSFQELLDKHQQRLRKSYQWQIDFANALMRTIDVVTATDDDVAQHFSRMH